MVVKRLLVVLFILAGFYSLCLAEDDFEEEFTRKTGITRAEIEELATKESTAQKALYRQFLPRPEELGQGWRAPWQVPNSRFANESVYWKSPGGGIEQGQFLAINRLSKSKINKYIDALVDGPFVLFDEIKEEELPLILPGLTKKKFNCAVILYTVGRYLAPSLTKRMEMLSRLVESSSGISASLIAQADELRQQDEKTKQEAMRGLLRPIVKEIMSPVAGMSTDDMKNAIITELGLVKKYVSMSYTRCDDWNALNSGETDIEKIRVKTVTIQLFILDRGMMADRIDDLKPENVTAFEKAVSAVYMKPFKLAIKIQNVELGRLTKERSSAQNDRSRQRLDKKINEKQQEIQEMEQTLSSMRWRVYPHDFGDNCYSIQLEGKVSDKHIKTAVPVAAYNASLRNGSAIVLISMMGNVSLAQWKNDLDRVLSTMDARTASFRE